MRFGAHYLTTYLPELDGSPVGGMSQELAHKNSRLFAEKVMPAFAGAGVGGR